jgi:hypothetical protein
MNERIKELADEAWQYANNNSRDGDDTHGWLYRDKFAELIVRECQTVVEWAISVDSTIGRVPMLIKEHFGVKE